MSERMKKQAIKNGSLIFRFEYKLYRYDDLSKEKANAVLSILNSDSEYINADSLSKEKIRAIKGKKEYRRAAYFVKLARKKESLTQLELAKKLKITQPNLSTMENARRPIGKEIAKRLSRIFKLNYKMFLTD
jgi:ribosome-binding protein aMBF1 (putative translation factor)